MRSVTAYLKRWLSRQDVKDIREGGNAMGMVLTQRQVYNIIRDPKQNFPFFGLLMTRAQENEALINNCNHKPKQHDAQNSESEAYQSR